MTKKLFVPNRILAQKNINPTPSPITKAFKEEPNKNESDPSKLDSSTLDRLPQPTGVYIYLTLQENVKVLQQWLPM